MDQLDKYRTIIARAWPELADAPMQLLNAGWDSDAVAVNNRLIVKFPRDEQAEGALVREHVLLDRVRPWLAMPLPRLMLHDGPPLISRHEMIPGEHLTAETYAALSETQRDALADQMGRFYAELHAIPQSVFDDLPPVTFDPQPSPDEVEEKIGDVLPDDLEAFATETLAGWRRLAPDPHGEVFCYFDGHGWNMAFDHQRGVLNGLYDFADAQIAPLQQEFVFSSFISRDLTLRIITVYDRLTGRAIDRARVDLLFGILLVKEISGWEDYPEKLPQILNLARAWVASR